MNRSKLLGSTALLAIGATMTGQSMITPAHADSLFVRDRNVSVSERSRPEFAAAGIRAGQFIVKPRLDLGIGYTSNAFAISDVAQVEGLDAFEEESDVFFLIRPSIRAETTWSRHAISFGAYGEVYQNRRFDTESITNAGADLNGQLDISTSAAAFGGVSYDHLHESRRVNNSAFLFEEPVEYDVARAYAGLQHELGRMRYRGRIDVSNYDYDDVEVISLEGLNFELPNPDQDFRDRTKYEVMSEVSVALSRDFSAFLQGSYEFHEYDQAADLQGFDRDSEGYNVGVGAEFDITRLARGRVAVGYFERDYEEASFGTVDGVSIDASLEWFPTEMTTVSLSASRGADESAVFEAGGYVSTQVSARVDHELRRNLLVHALAGYAEQDYPSPLPTASGGVRVDSNGNVIDQSIETFGVGTGATYYVNRNLSAGLEYTYEDQDVAVDALNGGFDTDYDVHQLLFTVTLKR